jgi:hypothetical protein
MLLDDAKTALTHLTQAQTAQATLNEAQALRGRRNELQGWVNPITTLANRVTWLREQQVALSPVPGEITNINNLVQGIRNRFAQNPTTETLLAQNHWQQLQTGLQAFATTAQKQQVQDWQHYFGGLFGGPTPGERANTLSLALPGNRENFNRYEDLYGRFNTFRNTVPNTPKELSDVLDYSAQLAGIRFIENADLPEAVINFHTAMNQGGASLDSITPELIEWLRQNGTLNNYRVRRI